jgi:DNA-directed RNA polymerase subunit RPC12/RpoP
MASDPENGKVASAQPTDAQFCSMCLAPVTSFGIASGKDIARDRRIHCAACSRQIVAKAAHPDPLQSGGDGWATSGLYPPT